MCSNPPGTSDTLGFYETGAVLVYGNGTVQQGNVLLTVGYYPIVNAIQGVYSSFPNGGRSAEQGGLNFWVYQDYVGFRGGSLIGPVNPALFNLTRQAIMTAYLANGESSFGTITQYNFCAAKAAGVIP